MLVETVSLAVSELGWVPRLAMPSDSPKWSRLPQRQRTLCCRRARFCLLLMFSFLESLAARSGGARHAALPKRRGQTFGGVPGSEGVCRSDRERYAAGARASSRFRPMNRYVRLFGSFVVFRASRFRCVGILYWLRHPQCQFATSHSYFQSRLICLHR